MSEILSFHFTNIECGRTVQGMIDLRDIRYVRLGTRDLDAATRFACRTVGLELARSEGRSRYFRSDRREHTLVYFDGDPTDHTVGFELKSTAALDHAGGELSDAGLEVRAGSALACEQRGVRAYINFRDPSGNSIDLVVGPRESTTSCAPACGAGITGFSHIGLCTLDACRDERVWTELLGARVSDRIGIAPLLRIDGVHHRVALFPAGRSGVQHINHQVASIDDVMRAWYRLRSDGVRIVFGPGRHPSSGAVFLYFEGPDSMVYEYSTGVRHISLEEEAQHQPRQFPMTRESFCMWGASPAIEEFKA
jgi:2,3-dihydroxy-p-cumate/2,3-dihydroxybenzoate 3,4-dioxygenase